MLISKMRSWWLRETVYQGHSSQPKTRASNRKVFVGPLVMQALARLKPHDSAPDDFVFPSDNKTPLSPNNVRNRILIAACKRAGIPTVGWHTFRYTYSTRANPSGESIKALQNQLGHVDSKITLGVYVQPILEAQRQIACQSARGFAPNCSQTKQHPETGRKG